MPFVLTLGAIQQGACEVYVTDPVFAEAIDGVLSRDADRLTIHDRDRAWRHVVDGANSADASGDRQYRDALTALSHRILTHR
jgi:hypothetical protein